MVWAWDNAMPVPCPSSWPTDEWCDVDHQFLSSKQQKDEWDYSWMQFVAGVIPAHLRIVVRDPLICIFQTPPQCVLCTIYSTNASRVNCLVLMISFCKVYTGKLIQPAMTTVYMYSWFLDSQDRAMQGPIAVCRCYQLPLTVWWGVSCRHTEEMVRWVDHEECLLAS